jgi:hypothetical protein
LLLGPLALDSGTLGPNDATDYHSHDRDTLYCILVSASAVNDVLTPPTYAVDAAESSTVTFEQGKRIAYYRASKPGEPYVHRVRSSADALAFVGVETRCGRPVSSPQAPRTTAPHGSGVVEADAYEFATAQRVVVGPRDALPLRYAADRPVARVVVRVTGPALGRVGIDGGPGVALHRAAERVEHGIRVGDVAVLDGVDTAASSGCVLRNQADEEACLIVVDVFGVRPAGGDL